MLHLYLINHELVKEKPNKNHIHMADCTNSYKQLKLYSFANELRLKNWIIPKKKEKNPKWKLNLYNLWVKLFTTAENCNGQEAKSKTNLKFKRLREQ